MNKFVKVVSISAAALLSASLLGGCATDQTASDAKEALDTANRAMACCNSNTERLDRMYQKIMGK